jgi:hypothetical protein
MRSPLSDERSSLSFFQPRTVVEGRGLEEMVIEFTCNGTKGVGVSLPSPEDGNRTSFRNVVSSCNLECRTIDKVQNPVDSVC